MGSLNHDGPQEEPELAPTHDEMMPATERAQLALETIRPQPHASFDDRFVELFDMHYPRLFRYLDRLCGDPEVAADVAQDALIRLYQRGAVPEVPGAWLLRVATNLLRNVMTTRKRRLRLLTLGRGERAHSDPAPSTDAEVLSQETRRRVRLALDRLSEREQRLILLRAEGYSYREISLTLDINEASIGTLLARAQREFRLSYGEHIDAT